MKQYRNIDTNEIWTEDEIRDEYESIFSTDSEFAEKYPTFEDNLEHMLDLGRQRVGGIVEAYWYAVMRDCDDQDWGYGSYDLDEAKEMCEKYPEGYIAVIDNSTDNPVCIEEMHQDEF